MNENRYAPPVAVVADIDSAVPSRPLSVKVGTWMLGIELALSTASAVWQFANPPAGLESGIGRVAYFVGMTIGFCFMALYVFFTYMAWAGRNWARIVLLVSMLIGVLASFWMLPQAFHQSTFNGVGFIVQFALNIVGVLLLFVAGANAWYRAVKAARLRGG